MTLIRVLFFFIFSFKYIISFSQGNELKWYSLSEAIELAKKNPKKILIDMYTDWCGWCKKMDRETFGNPAIAEYLSANFYPVKFNAETRDTLVYMGDTLLNKGTTTRSPHEFAVEMLHGKMSYPTIVYLDETGKLISPVPGYMSPSDIEPVLIFFARDIYKTTMFNDFREYFNKTFRDTVLLKDRVKWENINDAFLANSKNPRKILLFLNHQWCIECKIMLATTFNHDSIYDYLNKNFHPVFFDITSKDTVFFNGVKYGNENKEHPFHSFAVTLLGGKMNVPQMVYISEANQLISVVPGYFSPKNTEQVLHFFKEDAYLSKTWEEFLKGFKGNIE